MSNRTRQVDNWFDKVFNFVGDIIDRLLGRDDKYYQKLAKEGKILKGQVVKDFAGRKIREQVSKVTIVGLMEHSQKEYEKQKKLIKEDRYYPYFQEGQYDPTKDFIELYQIETETGNNYVMAFVDVADYEKQDMCIWFYKLERKIPTANLSSKDHIYYPAQTIK